MQSCNFGVSAFGEIIKRDGTRIVVFSDASMDKSGISKTLSILLYALSDINIESLSKVIEAKVNHELALKRCFNLTHSRIGLHPSWQPSQF